MLKASSLYLDITKMEGGIYIQEVIIQREMTIERGSIDICGEMIGTKNSKIYTRGHTAFYSIEKRQIVIKVNMMPTQHMVFE